MVLRGPVTARRPAGGPQRSETSDALEHLIARHNMLPRERAKIADRHQLDESHVPWVLEREPREILELVVVDVTHHDHVDLDGIQPGTLRRQRRAHWIERK
jgi:hypothetical protein